MSDIRKPFNIIRARNTPNVATIEGITVRRQEKLMFDGRYVKCAPYDNHFIFRDPLFDTGLPGRWEFLCTCGGMAGVTGYNAYRRDGSPTTREESTAPGEMLVCLIHANSNIHGDGSS